MYITYYIIFWILFFYLAAIFIDYSYSDERFLDKRRTCTLTYLCMLFYLCGETGSNFTGARKSIARQKKITINITAINIIVFFISPCSDICKDISKYLEMAMCMTYQTGNECESLIRNINISNDLVTIHRPLIQL